MALDFTNATSDRVVIPANSSIDSLDTISWLIWIYPHSLTQHMILSKVTASVGLKLELSFSGDGSILHSLNRVTSNDFVDHDNVPGRVSVNNWWCIAGSWDANAGGHGFTHHLALMGSALSTPSESYSETGIGDHDDSSEDLTTGNNSGTQTDAFDGKIARVMFWNRLLSRSELNFAAYAPRYTDGLVVWQECGVNGANAQFDMSGRGNTGTVTGATQSNHPPIKIRPSGIISYAAVPAFLGNPWNYYAQQG
jgi:hypothetical protein